VPGGSLLELLARLAHDEVDGRKLVFLDTREASCPRARAFKVATGKLLTFLG
jgi:hypothetical protein